MHLYTPLKIFHYQDKLDSLPRDVPAIKAPLHIRLKPTNACNHACRYCAYRSDALQLGKDMRQSDMIPKDKMFELVEDFANLGVKAVTFSGGGEPFCYPYLAETARRLADHGIAIASLTNGGRLAGEAAEIFAHKGVWVRVSMDGWDGPSYARYRGVGEDEFGRVLANMERFKAQGGPCFLGVSYIVDRENASHVYDMVRRLRDVGVDSVKIAPCVVANEGAANNDYHRPVYDEVKRQAARAVAELGSGPDFEVFDSYHLLDEKFAKDYTWCPYLQVLTVIGADQNVYSCQDKAYNLESGCLGSIAGRSFADFWLSDKDKFFTINPARDCNHHCVANAKNRLVLDYLSASPRHLPFV
jgi:MoaA/NifB/PqqE/SkfB family radical SAM enzyme